MKIISIGTFKGGVGKTTSALNIAGILAEDGYKVLCIDVDPQGNLTSSVGIERSTAHLIGIDEIFKPHHSVVFENIVVRSPISELENLDILPSTVLLHKSETDLASATAREQKLQHFIIDNLEEFEKYDYIIIDTNPSMGYLNQNAFMVSDKIIMPITADTKDTDGANLFMVLWDEIRNNLRIDDNIACVFITKLDKRNGLDKEFREYINTSNDTIEIKKLLLDSEIPVNIALKESAVSCLPINIFNKNCAGYNAYRNLINELIEKEVL